MAVTAYINVSAMIAQYGVKLYQALNVANGATITANAQLLDAIGKGNSMVDGYVRARYDPADVLTDPILVDAAAAVAWWSLLVSTRGEMAASDGVARVAQEDAVKTLKDIAKGAARGGIDLAFVPTDRTESLGTVARVTFGSEVANPSRADGASSQRWFGDW